MNYKQQMDEVLKNRRKNLDRFTSLLEDMLYNLKKEKSISKDELLSYRVFTDIYLCEAYLLSGRIREARKLGEHALKKLLNMEDDTLLPFLYDLLGYAYGCLDDYVGATTFFYAGIELANKKNDFEMLRILYSNFAITYIRLKQYSQAKEFIDKIYEMLQKTNLSEDKIDSANRNYHELLSEYYFGVGEYEKGLSLLETDHQTQDGNHNVLQYTIKSAIACTNLGKHKEAEQIISRFLQSDFSIQNPVTCFESYNTFLELSLTIKRFDFAEICLKQMQLSARKCNIPNFWGRYYESRIQACISCNQIPEDILYEKYFDYQQKIQAQREKNECIYIINQLEIYQNKKKQHQLENKNRHLMELSMLDELTKVYNRAGFQSQFSSLFSVAHGRQIPLGFCMIDLDYFKEINDHYGHLVGDDCLKTVAKIIQSSFGKEAVVCRYGGDEFVVITTGKNNEHFEDCLKKLTRHKNLKDIQCNKDNVIIPHLTLSVGAVNCIPTGDSTETDYIYTADSLLYQVKNTSKNGYLFENHLT